MLSEDIVADRQKAGDGLIVGLTIGKLAALMALASLVWLCAALFIRWLGPMGAFTGLSRVIVYGSTVVLTIPLNRRTLKIAGLSKHHMVTAIAVTTATATMLDGVAMSYFPELYGGDPAITGAGAAWLLWAIGVASALAVVSSAREGGTR
jgi:hypothetical protein